MISMSPQLEVIATCSALSRPHASLASGVVSADLVGAQYQGTGVPFAGVGSIAPRVRKGTRSGTTTWSPPV